MSMTVPEGCLRRSRFTFFSGYKNKTTLASSFKININNNTKNNSNNKSQTITKSHIHKKPSKRTADCTFRALTTNCNESSSQLSTSIESTHKSKDEKNLQNWNNFLRQKSISLRQKRKQDGRLLVLNPNLVNFLLFLFLYSIQHICSSYDVKSPVATFGSAHAAMSSSLDSEGRSSQCEYRCLQHQFQCAKSCKCIDNSRVCDDNYLDCGYKDISDEYTPECVEKRANQQLSNLHSECFSHYQATNNQQLPCYADSSPLCIETLWWCDGKPQCDGGLDEHELLCKCDAGFEMVHEKCELSSPCKDGHILCMTEDSDSILCMHPVFQCDGERNCPRGEDESPSICNQCSPENEGGQIGISCADNTECIQDIHFCDRTIDCLNGMDEIDCDRLTHTAPVYNSQTSSPTSKREMFPCEGFENRQAIYWIDDLHVCDGIQQCYGGSDERNCSYPKNVPQKVTKTPGKYCTETSCHHKCQTMENFSHKSATEVQCSCDEGYQLASDGYTCIYSLDLLTESDKIFSVLSSGDLLEVSVDPFGNQIDKRILRSGLYKDAPVTAIPAFQILLFFQSKSQDEADLVAFDLKKMTSDVIISDWVSPSITAIDYDSIHKILFWSEVAVDRNSENQWTSTLKASYVDVDQVRSYHDTLKVRQNQNVTLLRSDDGFLPAGFKISSIAQNAKFGELFVSGYFANGTGLIYLLNEDGSDFRVYVDNLQKPTNLKLDERQEMLYFIDDNDQKSIKRVKTHPLSYQLTYSQTVQHSDLTRRYEAPELLRKLSSENEQEFLSFEVLSNQIIYSEKYRGAFYTLGPISNFDSKVSQFNAGFLLGAKIIQKLPKDYVGQSVVRILASAKKDSKNFGEQKKCDDFQNCPAKGGICLPKNAAQSKCVCPDKTIHDSIRNKCKPEILPFVVMATNANILGKSGLHGQDKFEIAAAGNVRDIYHDDTWVYWINGITRQIERVSAALLSTASAISKIEPEVVISGLDEPYSLAIDSAGGALFWTETTRLTIEVSDLDGSYPSVLISRDKAPKFIALDLLDGLIFWTEDKSHSVWRANMDGTDLMEIVSTYNQNCLPDEIKFEPVTSQVYFSCVGIQEKKLFSASITGSSTSDIVELADFKGQNWCFTLYKRSVVVGRYGLRSYANHNAEIDSAIRVTTDGITRVDVFTQENNQVSDPCERKKCSQRCLRKSASPYYTCLCYFGFQVDPNNSSNCVERKDSDILLLSHDKGIKMVFLSDNPILPGDVRLPKQSFQKRISEFDYDPKSMQLFYLQSHFKEPPEPIRRTHLLSGELQFEYAKGEDVILFTLDRVGRKIYYAEAQCQCIKVCDVDLMSANDVSVRTKTLVSKNLGKPILGLVIDYDDGMLFWTHELGEYRVLEKIDMSGAESTRSEIKAQKRTKGDFEYPAIDTVNNQIYYTFKEKIERTTFGKNGVNYFEEVVDKSNLYGVTYIKNTIYFGSHDSLSHTSVHTFSTRAVSLYPKTGSVQTMGQTSNSQSSNHPRSSGASYYLFSQLISSQSFSVNHIHAYSYDNEEMTSEDSGTEVINHCANLNGHCEYMCLRNAQRRRSCVCPDGVALEPDGKRCKPDPQDFILLPTERIFVPSMITDLRFTFDQIVQPYSVDFIYRRREIFIGSRQNGIFRTDFNGNNLKQIIPYIPDLENIAVDWIAENIFWINKEGLFVSRTNGSFTKTILSTSQNVFSRPRGLAVHPFRSMVYMTDWENKPRIIRVYMDGSGYQDIIKDATHIRWPSSLTIDFSRDFVLWVDYSGHRIHGCFYDGTGGLAEYIERPKTSSIQDITTLNSTIFYTEMSSYGALYVYNVSTLEPDKRDDINLATLHQGFAHANTDWKARSLAFVTADKQPIKSPFNGVSNDGCSTMAQFQCQFLCLSNADRIQCVCPDKHTPLCTASTRKKGVHQATFDKPDEIVNPPINPGSSSQTGNIIGSRLQDFELKLVMIVLVVIAVVVIILMVAILLLIRRHMIAAPPVVPPRAIFTNGDNNQSATLILTTAQPIHGHPGPPGTRFQNQVPPPPPFPHPPSRRPRGLFNRFNTSHANGITSGIRPLNNQLWHSQQNDYVDMPPHAFHVGHFKNSRNGNYWAPASLKNTNLSATLSPPPYSPPSSTRLSGFSGVVGMGGNNRNSANNFPPFWPMSTASTHYFRPGLLSGSTGTGNASSDATTPRTFSENSSEDLHQHSNDDSSTA